MTPSRYDVLLSVGSNVLPDVNVPRAKALIAKRFALVQFSAVYAGPALDAEGRPAVGQPPFVNFAVRIATDLPYRALREVCRFIEDTVGRVRTADRFAPRPLDLDPVFGDARFLDTSAGALPAADLAARAYVLVPAADVWPEAVLPDGNLTLAERVAHLPEEERGMLRRRSSG